MTIIKPDSYLRMRQRFRADGEIDAELYGLLRRLASAIVFGGRLAPAYSPSGRWDGKSFEDALQGWIERRLLQTNALLAAFDLTEHPRPFLASLERNFRHYLENSRERGELGNLISRSGELLRDDVAFKEWLPQGRPSDSWWGLASWRDPEAYQGPDQNLVSHAWALGAVPIFRYSQSVERASPVLSTETLRGFLIGLFERAERLLTISHLAIVYRDRFDLGGPVPAELSAAAGAVAPEVDSPEEGWVSSAAAALAGELSPRQLEAITRSYRGETLEEVAAGLGVSRGTADNALRSAGPMIDKQCVDGVTRRLLLEKLLDVLSIDD